MKWFLRSLGVVTLAFVMQHSAAAQDTAFPIESPAYRMYRLQHANPYTYGMPAKHFRWGWFGASPRWDSTHERGEYGRHHIHRGHHMHPGDFHQWTKRYSY